MGLKCLKLKYIYYSVSKGQNQTDSKIGFLIDKHNIKAKVVLTENWIQMVYLIGSKNLSCSLQYNVSKKR